MSCKLLTQHSNSLLNFVQIILCVQAANYSFTMIIIFFCLEIQKACQNKACNYLYFVPCGQRHSSLRPALMPKLSASSQQFGTAVNATVSREYSLQSAIGSQTLVHTLTLTWKTSHFPFCSGSQDIFLLNHEENHPFKQDFLGRWSDCIHSPQRVCNVRVEEGEQEGERMTVNILGRSPFPWYHSKCLFLSHSYMQRCRM